MKLFQNDAYQLSMLYSQWVTGRSSVIATAEAFFRRFPHEDDQDMVVMAGAYRINELLNSVELFTYEDMPFIQHSVLKLSDSEFKPFQSYLPFGIS